MEKIAFLGTGSMGLPMARRLLEAGFPLTVWNRTPARAEPLVSGGATAAASPADAVRDADVVVTMLSDPAAVRDVVGAFASALRPGVTLVEASTIGPEALRELRGLLPEGVALVDAPVMGSADRAASGELMVLAGGDVAKVRHVLDVFGSVIPCGPEGSGAALKVVLISAVIAGVTVVGEAMALADGYGIPEEQVKQALSRLPLAGLAGRAFGQGSTFALRLAAKDVALATASADLPVAEAVHGWLTSFPGAGDEDLGRIVHHIREERRA
ncbi:NAD(P)-dependent oxidoreductase [Streptomyces liangshanensis]|uniref:NAD(P)-dependent oxidoreductase n=1 Tax=Streptomyces liangshanensis TaxID=2717324 RepID=A0A6G9GT05_9ACTN|nr:NAD(P)-dependent oxidoreductase [Streptomyces liangshanensis]QIQ01206.1 NAD(P)-dependent oxidoreductase [Streptomyces liangshanensis]